MPRNVTLVRTGVANTASVIAALERCGCACEISEDAGAVEAAETLVLPGVGSFAAGMESLDNAGLTGVVRERIRRGRATLAVCLGLQLLAAESEEAPGVAGLGVIEGHVTRFGRGVSVPQFGWNRIESAGGLVEPGFAYFANSYRLTDAPLGWQVAWSDHGGRFVAAIQRDAVLACQFHPELSGQWGQSLLRRWLAMSAVVGSNGGAAC